MTKKRLIDNADFQAGITLYLEVNQQWVNTATLLDFAVTMGVRVNRQTAYQWLQRMFDSGKIERRTVSGGNFEWRERTGHQDV